jgi:hypothetical protein
MIQKMHAMAGLSGGPAIHLFFSFPFPDTPHQPHHDSYAAERKQVSLSTNRRIKPPFCPNPAHTCANKGRFTVKSFGHFDPLLASPAVL